MTQSTGDALFFYFFLSARCITLGLELFRPELYQAVYLTHDEQCSLWLLVSLSIDLPRFGFFITVGKIPQQFSEYLLCLL